jgi:hypothetical protein
VTEVTAPSEDEKDAHERHQGRERQEKPVRDQEYVALNRANVVAALAKRVTRSS